MNRERIQKIIGEEFKDYMPKGFNFYEPIKKSADRIIAEEGKVINYEKSALPEMCKMMGVPYNENIVGFVKEGVIVKKEYLQPQQPKLPEEVKTEDLIRMSSSKVMGKINEILDYLKAREV